jgi:hypothetical protein
MVDVRCRLNVDHYKLMVLHAAYRIDRGEGFRSEVSMAPLSSSPLAKSRHSAACGRNQMTK